VQFITFYVNVSVTSLTSDYIGLLTKYFFKDFLNKAGDLISTFLVMSQHIQWLCDLSVNSVSLIYPNISNGLF